MVTNLIDLAKEIARDHFLTMISIRIGIIFLVIVLLKILVSFYKYNIKLASFYESRRHALTLSGIEDLKRVKVFSTILSIDKIDFEKETSDPNDFVDAIKKTTNI